VIEDAKTHSQYTHDRARSASVEILPSDESLVSQADYILSIVPPRDAIAVAKRIGIALESAKRANLTNIRPELTLHRAWGDAALSSRDFRASKGEPR
jgi:hypothetical protein